MSAKRARSRVAPWVSVTAVILAAVLLGIAIIVGNLVLTVIALVIILVTGLEAAIVPRRLGMPITFGAEFPANTIGPRATSDGDSSPPIATRRHPEPTPADAYLDEVTTDHTAALPDHERVFPQYVNLAPGDRLRQDHGHLYIERGPDLETEPEDEAEPEEHLRPRRPRHAE